MVGPDTPDAPVIPDGGLKLVANGFAACPAPNANGDDGPDGDDGPEGAPESCEKGLLP